MNATRALRALALGLVASLALAVPACREAAATPELAHAYPSKEALARAVLHGLENADTAGLVALRVTRDEHRDLLWAELPESRDTPFEFAWGLNQSHSRKALRAALARYAGTPFELLDVEFTEPDEVYDGFTLHFGARLHVRRSSDGRVGDLEILDVMLERNGAWKLMNYRD